MASYLVDSSVLLDVFSNDPTWLEWSLDRLDRAYAEGTVFLNPVIYSEVSIRFSRIEEFEAALREGGCVWSEIPREALFLREGLPGIQKSRRPKDESSPGFFHRRPCGGVGSGLIDPRSRKGTQALPEAAYGMPELTFARTSPSPSITA